MTDTAALVFGTPCLGLAIWFVCNRVTAGHHVQRDVEMQRRLDMAREAEATRAYVRHHLRP